MSRDFLRQYGLGALLAALIPMVPVTAPAQIFQQPQQQNAASPVCQRLEAQLGMIDRGTMDPARAEQARRYEDAAARQQSELDRVTTQGKRMGCDSSGFFSLFTGQNPQCGPINNRIQQMRSNLDQITANLERLRGTAGTDRDFQRRSVMTALAQNNCGPQYANAARSGSFFDIFRPADPGYGVPSSTFRTVCVRTCDGYFFPISFSTVPDRFADDENKCRSLCPAAEATLFTYRNPGEDISSAVSIGGVPYTQLPNAFKYRQEVNPSCACRAPGQSWADALKTLDDRSTLEQGDIIVTEESAKQMQQRDARGRPIQAPESNAAKGQPAASSNTTTSPAKSNADRPIRTVGPAFYPTTKTK